jgi:isopenicillin-N epimerase
MLRQWRLDPAVTYLNHGTVGAPPARVLEVQQAIREDIERQPAQYLLRELSGAQPMPWRAEGRLREAQRPVAAFIGADPDDIVFAANVTVAINAVLQSLALQPGDEVLITDLAYGAIVHATRFATRRAGAVTRVLEMPFPIVDEAVVVAAVRAALTPSTRLVVLDHVPAMSALLMPVAEVVRVCRAAGVPVLIDGAHAPGAIDLDVRAIGADWYAANLHKWAHAPRSCGILWAAPSHQAGLHHPITSWGRDRGFLGEFDRTATLDPTAYLAAPEGLAMIGEWGAPKVFGYMHDLAWRTARTLTSRWSTALATPRDLIGAMVTVPLPETLGRTDQEAADVRTSLLLDDRIEVQVVAKDGRLWTRISTQVYNDDADVARLAEAVLRRA